MRRFILRAALALLTFTISVAVASVWMVSRIPIKEEPPCRSCSELYSSSQILTVTLCEISANPVLYRGQIVRVRAVFHHDGMTIHLLDSCGRGGAMYAGMAESCGACDGARKALSIYSGYETWYDNDADVVVIGRSGSIEGNNFYQGYEGFNILCVERVEPFGLGVWQRIQYTVGQVADFFFKARHA